MFAKIINKMLLMAIDVYFTNINVISLLDNTNIINEMSLRNNDFIIHLLVYILTKVNITVKKYA